VTVDVHETANDTSRFAFIGHSSDVPWVPNKSDRETALFLADGDLQGRNSRLVNANIRKSTLG